MKDWKTTTAGVMNAVAVVLAGVAATIDGDPSTAMDTQGVIAAAAVILGVFGVSIGGVFAKDKDKED